MSSPDEQSSYMEPSSPIGRIQSGLAASFVTPSPKKTDGKADQVVDDKPYIDKRKSSSTMAAKGDLTNGPSLEKTDSPHDGSGEGINPPLSPSPAIVSEDAPLPYPPCSSSDGGCHHPPPDGSGEE